MSGFITPGSNVPTRVAFNSGTIDFGSNRLVDVMNLKMDLKFSNTIMYVLNSIKGATQARHSFSVQCTGTITSWSPEMDMLMYGSSTIGTPQEIDVLDGQPTLINPVITGFDNNGKEFQYQLQNALFTTESADMTQEAYNKWDFTIVALDVKEIYTQ